MILASYSTKRNQDILSQNMKYKSKLKKDIKNYISFGGHCGELLPAAAGTAGVAPRPRPRPRPRARPRPPRQAFSCSANSGEVA